LPHSETDFTFCTGAPKGLVARPDPAGSGGEILTYDDGFSETPPTAGAGDDIFVGKHANSSGVIARIDNYRMLTDDGVKVSDEDTKAMVLLPGNGTNDESMQLWQMRPSSNLWEEIVYGGAVAVTANGGIDGDTATSVGSMPDSCTHPGGAPNRANDAGAGGITLAGAIAQPCWVFTNNVDPVFVFPNQSSGTAYEELTDQFTEFRAISCETFGDRVYFLNTFENDDRFPQRLRRTPRGTADPTTSGANAVGSGSIDMEEFSGQGLRCETLGDVLACYFEDGTAFVRQTGIATVPNEVQVLDERRGLLGTHSVTRVGDNKHFGIFTDGWWLLDSSARWTKVGIASLGGAEVTKWTDTFYSTLDYPSTHRIQMGYDPVKNWVRISQPIRGSSLEFAVWIYDLNSDRVWLDEYVANPTCWGNVNIPSAAAQTWAAEQAVVPPTTWAEREAAETTWGALTGATFGSEVVVHGTDTARVMEHSPETVLKDGQQPSWSYPAPALDHGDPYSLKTTNRIRMEYINVGNTRSVSLLATDGRGNESAATDTMNQGSVGDIEVATSWHRLTDEKLGFEAGSIGDVKIKSFELEYFDEGVERVR
jgi:hypothetical protein